MTELRTLYRHVSHYLGGRVGLILLGFLSFPLFTRLFSVAQYGIISLVVKTILVFTVLSKLGVQNSVLRFYEEHAVSPDRNSLRRYYSTLFFGSAFIAGLVNLAFVVGLWCMPRSLVSPSLKGLLTFASALIFIRGMQSVLAGFLRVEGKTKTYNGFDVATKVATIGLVCALFLTWDRGVLSFFTGTIVAELIAILLLTALLLKARRISPRQLDPKFLYTAWAFGFPLIGYELASVILDSGDRILVQHYLGAQAVGFYSAAYNISSYLQECLMSPVNLALFPIYMRLWVTKGKEATQEFLSRGLDNFLMVAIGVVCGAVVTSHDAVILLASRKFQQADRLLPTLIIGLMIYAVHIFLNAGLLIHRKTYTMAKLVFYACVLNILMNIYLLPRIGLQGAAIATLVSYAFLILLMARESFALFPLRIEFRACLKYLLAASLTAGILSQLHVGSAFTSFAIKGTSCLTMYGTILWLIDRRVRAFCANLAHLVTRGSQTSEHEATPEITSVAEN